MAMSERISCSGLAALLILATFFASTALALEIVNKQRFTLTVFVPPICQPCHCPMIYCIRAPCIQNCECPQVQCKKGMTCEQPECFCSKICKIMPGVEVEVGCTVTLSVENEEFPLSFVTVEVKKRVYVVKAADLKCITKIATVVVTRKPCGKGEQGIVALVYPNPKFAQHQRICLVRGERYGS